MDKDIVVVVFALFGVVFVNCVVLFRFFAVITTSVVVVPFNPALQTTFSSNNRRSRRQP